MDTFEAIYSRRAVKYFDPNHEMTDAEIEKLLDAAMQSPSSFNMQNWRFVVIRNKELKSQLRVAAFDQAQVTDAALVIILAADLLAWKRNPHRYWRNAPPDVADMLVNWMGPFYENNPQLQRDEAMRSSGLVGQTIMLAAKAMGYDSCPMIGYDPEQVARLINLPDDHVLGFMLTIGKALKPAWPKPGMLQQEDVVVYDRFADQHDKTCPA